MGIFNINTFEGYMKNHTDQIVYHLEQAFIDEVQASLNLLERVTNNEDIAIIDAFVQRYSAKKDMAERIIGKELVVDESCYIVEGFRERR